MVWTKLARLTAITLLSCTLMGGSCEDPPGAFILGIQTVLPDEPNPVLGGGSGETLESFSGLEATVSRIEVIHRTIADDPMTESRITIVDEEQTVLLAGDLQELAPRQIGFFVIPEGFVVQFRFIVSSI